MTVHLCLRTCGREVSSRLADPGPQWASVPEIIIIIIIIIITK